MVNFKKEFVINRLRSGGVITNYSCTSRCGHCLYGCSPRWPGEYVDGDTLTRVLKKIRGLGCRSVHIGGGEPFLDPEGLGMVVETTRREGVGIDYVETNSSWYRDRDSACALLEDLKGRGLETLLVSMSPFHNEHIPFMKVKGVLEACRQAGMNVFPWIPEFYSEIDGFDDNRTHSLVEYEEAYGRDYLKKVPSRYWVHFGGRALRTFAGVFETRDYREILTSERGGCRELLDVSHFHFDLYDNYIPGLCSGLAIAREDMGKPLSPERYPFLCALFEEGIRGLFDLVSSQHGYMPSRDYLSKCDLCFDIRRFLVLDRGIEAKELRPGTFYEEA
jgi:hypothetical protein